MPLAWSQFTSNAERMVAKLCHNSLLLHDELITNLDQSERANQTVFSIQTIEIACKYACTSQHEIQGLERFPLH
jgi:hypothetical protein